MVEKKKDSKKPKLNMQDVLAALDLNNKDFYRELPDENKKAVAMQEVVLRWLSAVGKSVVDFEEAKNQGRKKGDGKGPWPTKEIVDNEYTQYYLIMTNEGPNIGFGYHSLYDHPELEWMLLSLVGAGAKQEHIWIPGSPKSETPTIDAMLRQLYPLANTSEIKMLKSLASREEIINMVKGYGNPDKLSSSESLKVKQEQGGVFDLNTIEAELKKIGK